MNASRVLIILNSISTGIVFAIPIGLVTLVIYTKNGVILVVKSAMVLYQAIAIHVLKTRLVMITAIASVINTGRVRIVESTLVRAIRYVMDVTDPKLMSVSSVSKTLTEMMHFGASVIRFGSRMIVLFM